MVASSAVAHNMRGTQISHLMRASLGAWDDMVNAVSASLATESALISVPYKYPSAYGLPVSREAPTRERLPPSSHPRSQSLCWRTSW